MASDKPMEIISSKEDLQLSEEEMIDRLLKSGKYNITKCDDKKPAKGFEAGIGLGRGMISSNLFASSTPCPGAIPKRYSPASESLMHHESLHGGYALNIPKLPTFSGEEPCSKGEVSFKEWEFEVKMCHS